MSDNLLDSLSSKRSCRNCQFCKCRIPIDGDSILYSRILYDKARISCEKKFNVWGKLGMVDNFKLDRIRVDCLGWREG